MKTGEHHDGSLPDSWFNSFFAYLIVFSIGLVVISTEFASASRLANISSRLEAIIGVLFLVEYLIRAWVSPLSKRYGKGIKGITSYALTLSKLSK